MAYLMNTTKTDYSYSLIAFGIAISFSLFWLYIGEPWPIFGDAKEYLAMSAGKMGRFPFGYRILMPYLAHLLPFATKASFMIITILCLALASGIMLLYEILVGRSKLEIFTLILLWVTSFPFVYYSTTFIRANGPVFPLIALVILFSKRRVSWIFLFIIIGVGTLSHETMLVLIPMLWLDKRFSGSITGAVDYRYWQLACITIGCLALSLILTQAIQTLPSAAPTYMSMPIKMFHYVLNYSGGYVKHALRIYAAYGPVFIFCSFYILFNSAPGDMLSFLGLFAIAVFLTFLATDTLRVMSVIFLPVLIYAKRYLHYLWLSGRHLRFWFLLVMQCCYTYIVFGHLRSFESSTRLYTLAAIVCIVALLICLSMLEKEFILQRVKMIAKMSFNRIRAR